MFCQCKNQQNFDTLIPNTNICPVCSAQPGALPTLSKEVLKKALILGKALKCTINNPSHFDRKSYFYPDMPMGYQITQLYKPTNVDGKVSFYMDNFSQERLVHIQDAHMESDTGKMIHNGGEALLDFNRAGTPLVEIVTNPDFSSDDEVVEFLKELQRIVRYNDISDADMEKGQMRVDVNISIRKNQSDPYGTRVEVKNMNSFSSIKRAIEYEYNRQAELYDSGQTFVQQTRGRDDVQSSSYLMRSKEDVLDYRYFPEPDMPPLLLDDEMFQFVDSLKLEIPFDIITQFKNYGFHKEYINAIINDKDMLDYFLYAMQNIQSDQDTTIIAKTIAKWLAGPIVAWIKDKSLSLQDLKFSQSDFIDFVMIASQGEIIDNQLKIVMDIMIETGESPQSIVSAKGFDQVDTDNDQLKNIIDSVISANASIVEQYKGGKTTTLGFFVGQVMKQTAGQYNPKIIGDKITEILNIL